VEEPVGVVEILVWEVVLDDVVVVAVLLEGPVDVELAELVGEIDEDVEVEEVVKEVVEGVVEGVVEEVVEVLDDIDEELEVNEVDEDVEELLREDPDAPIATKTLARVT
jgi:hypothetical protein